MKARLLLAMFVALTFVFGPIFAQDPAPAPEASTVEAPAAENPDVSPADAVTAYTNIKSEYGLAKDVYKGVKEGGWKYVLANLAVVIGAIIGLARAIAKGSEILLLLIMKYTDKADNWIANRALPIVRKILEVIANLTGWLSLTFGLKGSNAVKKNG